MGVSEAQQPDQKSGIIDIRPEEPGGIGSIGNTALVAMNIEYGMNQLIEQSLPELRELRAESERLSASFYYLAPSHYPEKPHDVTCSLFSKAFKIIGEDISSAIQIISGRNFNRFSAETLCNGGAAHTIIAPDSDKQWLRGIKRPGRDYMGPYGLSEVLGEELAEQVESGALDREAAVRGQIEQVLSHDEVSSLFDNFRVILEKKTVPKPADRASKLTPSNAEKEIELMIMTVETKPTNR